MSTKQTELEKKNHRAAGIDIGSEYIYISVEGEEVKEYSTFTKSLEEAISYLRSKEITSAAMEAMGVYWMVLYDMIEKSGIEAYLVDGRAVKNVPGRKSDVKDCQWIQQLHSYGLLRRCIIPEEDMRELRAEIRLRESLVQKASKEILHMQKAMDQMNIKLHNVLEAIDGLSGMTVIKAILKGEHNPEKLVELCHKSVKIKKRDAIIESLRGNYKREYLRQLQVAVDFYEYTQEQIRKSDKVIEVILKRMTIDKDEPSKTRSQKPVSKNHPKIEEIHSLAMKLTGNKDLSILPGCTDWMSVQIISEVGIDMNKWKSVKHFTSYLGLAPNIHQSGKSNKKRFVKKSTRAGQMFRLAAYGITHSKKHALASFYHRVKSKKGSKIAIKATARKIAELFYMILTKGTEFVEQGIIAYQKKLEEQRLKSLQKAAKKYGYNLVPV